MLPSHVTLRMAPEAAVELLLAAVMVALLVRFVGEAAFTTRSWR